MPPTRQSAAAGAGEERQQQGTVQIHEVHGLHEELLRGEARWAEEPHGRFENLVGSEPKLWRERNVSCEVLCCLWFMKNQLLEKIVMRDEMNCQNIFT